MAAWSKNKLLQVASVVAVDSGSIGPARLGQPTLMQHRPPRATKTPCRRARTRMVVNGQCHGQSLTNYPSRVVVNCPPLRGAFTPRHPHPLPSTATATLLVIPRS